MDFETASLIVSGTRKPSATKETRDDLSILRHLLYCRSVDLFCSYV